ncbi:DgyrCDS4430 [Dimorphilus gyrociliatus]|uniref:DgyrCDS4430 n=1 Tax=Dimorphilus gyrociliatus TaxID=2664684 RepID=A0A7I8VH09_9ANNE|nr:DgyrCDS4430 [Dimorphilus gyrociliatus]
MNYTDDIPVSRVELQISCNKLLNMDFASYSDPFCVLYMTGPDGNAFHEKARTETIKDTLNPSFVTSFEIDYYFEKIQRLRFAVYDSDSSKRDLEYHDFLGDMECNLSEIVSQTVLTRPLGPVKNKTNTGIITVRCEEVIACKEAFTMEFHGRDLNSKGLFSSSSPFLEITKSTVNEDEQHVAIYRTEPVKNTSKPSWPSFRLKAQKLCNGDFDRPLKFNIYNWKSSGKHSLFGSFTATVRDLKRGPTTDNIFPVIDEKKAHKKSYSNSGTVCLVNFREEVEYSFIDFIQGGLQVHLSVAVDFTQSNGDPAQSDSLHYHTSTRHSQYAYAIEAVGSIIQDYDSQKQFIGTGFGAKMPDGTVSHCFNLSMTSDPTSHSVGQLLQQYYECLMKIKLYGPTNFAPTINALASSVRQNLNGHYYILLIVTDGVITDMAQTKSAIVSASGLPISIIIVGVGSANFSAMNELDSDDVKLTSGGRTAERDIVQFVPFRECQIQSQNCPGTFKAILAKEVLAEVPEQITGYMRSRGIKPGQR